jgi:hypothetical protein
MFRAILVLSALLLNALAAMAVINKDATKSDSGIWMPPTMEDFGGGHEEGS